MQVTVATNEDAGRLRTVVRGCAEEVTRDVCILNAHTRTYARPIRAPADEWPERRVALLLIH
jgi:hypothetical protein